MDMFEKIININNKIIGFNDIFSRFFIAFVELEMLTYASSCSASEQR